MAVYSKGSRALMISMRSGAAFPYNEMVQEWNGSWVHNSEFEVKQPQLTPRPVGADAQALQHAYPARTEFGVLDLLMFAHKPKKRLLLEICFFFQLRELCK